MITVIVHKLWSSGEQQTISVPSGSTLSAVASMVGAPTGCTFRVNGGVVNGGTEVGNGDTIYINKVKYDAGC